jgi:hypothetical protein
VGEGLTDSGGRGEAGERGDSLAGASAPGGPGDVNNLTDNQTCASTKIARNCAASPD